MDNHAFSEATAIPRPRLYGIVQTYIQRQLPRDIHPAFKALRDRGEAATVSTQIRSTEEATLPLSAEQVERSRTEQVDGNKDDLDDGLPPYADSQGQCRFTANLVKRRIVQRCRE